MNNSKEKIFLVEKSSNLRFILKDYFEILNYEVTDFENPAVALKAFNSRTFDTCLVDAGPASHDNLSFLQEIRKLDKDVPVIIISGNNAKEDRIQAFKMGCDDYVSKPFSTEELSLRIAAILRRTKNSVSKNLYKELIYKFGNFVFNYSGMQLIHPTITRTLTKKEAELLKLFCEHQNKLLSREIILKEIWGGDDDFSIGRSMDVFLTKLRAYINIEKVPDEFINEEGGKRHKYMLGYEPKVEIKNVHGAGFILKVKE